MIMYLTILLVPIGVVETDFGFHVIKARGKNDAVLMGTVAQKYNLQTQQLMLLIQKQANF